MPYRKASGNQARHPQNQELSPRDVLYWVTAVDSQLLVISRRQRLLRGRVDQLELMGRKAFPRG